MAKCRSAATWCSPGGPPGGGRPAARLADSLDRIPADLERRHGPLTELGRKEKRNVVRILEERGAFFLRHGVETVASALGVSRFTVYNHLNREKPERETNPQADGS